MSKYNVDSSCKYIMPQACECGVNEQDVLASANIIMLDVTLNPEGRLLAPYRVSRGTTISDKRAP